MDFLKQFEEIDEELFDSLGDEWTIDGQIVQAIPEEENVDTPIDWYQRLGLLVPASKAGAITPGLSASRQGEDYVVAAVSPPKSGIVTVILERP